MIIDNFFRADIGKEYLKIKCDKCGCSGTTRSDFIGMYKNGFDENVSWYQRGKKHYCINCAKDMLVKK